MRSVPIPGQILRTDVFLGLTFDELVTLGSVPLVIVFPSLFIEQIPLIGTLIVILLSFIGVGAVIIRTPDGQTPLEWAPAALKRRLTPDTYYIKPRTRNRDSIPVANVVQTSDVVKAESLALTEAAQEQESGSAQATEGCAEGGSHPMTALSERDERDGSVTEAATGQTDTTDSAKTTEVPERADDD